MPEVFLSRQPVLNRQGKIIANRFRLNFPDPRGDMSAAAAALTALAEVWPQGEKSVFISAGAPLGPDLLLWAPPENTVLEIPPYALEGGGRGPAGGIAGPSLCPEPGFWRGWGG